LAEAYADRSRADKRFDERGEIQQGIWSAAVDRINERSVSSAR